MSDKINKTVVRNAAYRSGEFNLRERHNERKNESYHNGDIDLSRKHMNVIFHENLFLSEASGYVEKETYEQTFNRLLDEGKIVKRGLQQDAKIFDELIFDVNTAYFENNGGFDYAVSFFEEAYRLAVKEIGGEDFILSAVLHADEKNKALSEQLGRDVYHYHLHVVYVPVVQKEILWSKRTKDKSLIGKVKEVIPQISHSKKWPMRVPVERDGKTIMLNSYSLLQDRFYEHMRETGFEGFERGERGSTTEHLTDLEYKTKMEAERLTQKTAQVQEQEQAAAVLTSILETKQRKADTLSSVVEEKQHTVASLDMSISDKQSTTATLDKEAEVKKKQLENLKKKTATAKDELATVASIERLGDKRGVFGAIQLSPEDWQKVLNLAIEGVKSVRAQREHADRLDLHYSGLNREIERLTRNLARYEGQGITENMRFYEARQRAPQRMEEVIADIMRQPPEQEQRRTDRTTTKKNDIDR